MKMRFHPTGLLTRCILAGSLALTASCCPAQDILIQKISRQNTDSMLAIEPATGKTVLEYDRSGFLNESFPTGSLIKIFTIIAALEQDFRLRNLVVHCGPSRNSVVGCWNHAGHGDLTMRQAIAISCNQYIRVLGERVAPERFWRVLADYGLIEKQDIPAYLSWSRADTVEAMVGTGTKLKIPPRSLLYAYAALFNGGILYRPGGIPGQPGAPVTISTVRRKAEILEILREGMQECCVQGSGTDAQVSTGPGSVVGKTGTAAYYYAGNPGAARHHGLFVGFFPETGVPDGWYAVFS